MEICGLLTLVNNHWQEHGDSESWQGQPGQDFRESCWAQGAAQVTMAVELAGLDILFSSLSAQLTSPQRMRSL